MDQIHQYPPLTVLEKLLVDSFCSGRPCEANQALRKQRGLIKRERQEAFYEACRQIRTRVHYCPLEGGFRYVSAVESDPGNELPTRSVSRDRPGAYRH